MIEKNVKRNKMLSTAIVLSMVLAALPAMMMISPTPISPISADAQPAVTDEKPTLSVYGYQNFGAGDTSIVDPITTATVEDPPYTDAVAPLNPQHSQAPVKDSITFNPIYISELDSDDELMGVVSTGPYIDQLKASGQDVNEKVFMKQWYEPWHWDKDVDGDGDWEGPMYDEELLHGDLQWLRDLPVYALQELDWLDEDDEIYPAIMQEFTFMFVEAKPLSNKPEPIPGYMGTGIGGENNKFVFPIGIREDPETLNPGYQYLWSPYGYGLTGLDANFDGEADVVYIESEKTLFGYTISLTGDGIAADFDGDQNISPLDTDGYQLSGDELAIFRTREFPMERGDRLQFLDHMIEVVDTFTNTRLIGAQTIPIKGVKVAIWYTGDLEPEFLGYQVIDDDDMVLVGRKLPVTYIRSVENGGGGTNLCDFPTGPWFIYVSAVNTGAETATITVGRALGHTHTAMEDGQEEQDLRHGDPWWLKRFYVDGHEYNVVAIETVHDLSKVNDGNGGAEFRWNWQTLGWADLLVNDLELVDADDPFPIWLDAAEDNDFVAPPQAYREDWTGFKYITIRTPIPKSGQRQNPAYVDPAHEIVYADRDAEYSVQGESEDTIRDLGYYHLIEQHSIRLQPYFIDDMLSVLPPFNYEHSILLDIQKNWSGIWDMTDTPTPSWVSEPEWMGSLKTLVSPITQTSGSYHTLDGRTIATEHMMYVGEDRNPQYKGELKELLYEYSNVTCQSGTEPSQEKGFNLLNLFPDNVCNTTGLNEAWYVEQWNTLPDEYTEFILPEGNELYLFTSAFMDRYAIGRILNQELGDDDIQDERFWDDNDIDFDSGGLTQDIPEAVTDVFGSDLLQNRIDRDGPYFRDYLYWYFEMLYNEAMSGSAWSGSYTNGIQYIDGNRVKFWFDPTDTETTKKYKDEEGIRLYGFDSTGAGQLRTYDPWTLDPANGRVVPGDRDGNAANGPEIIEYPPYTDPMAPFNPESVQAPGMDSLTFDPAYMNEYEHGGEDLSDLYKMISIEEADAREKVFFRMWYEPWQWDKDCNSDGSPFGPDAIWLFDPDFQEVWYWPVKWLQGHSVPSDPRDEGYVEEYAGQEPPMLYGRGGGQDNWEFLDGDDEIHPALMQEFTYMYVNPFNMPDHGQPATSRFAFPMGTTEMELWSEFGYGLTTFDCDFDLNDDIVTVHSENSLSRYTEIGADFNGDGVLQQLDLDDTALNGNEIVVFAVHNVNLDTDPETDIGADVMFLDNLARVTDVGNDQVQFTIYRTSGTTQENIQPQRISAISLEPGQMQLIEHTSLGTKLSRNQNNLGQTDGAWFIYLEALDDGHNRCVVTVGRALGCTHTAMDIDGSMDTKRGDPWYMKRFYVDGHEYNVVAIMTVREDDRVAGGWNNSKEEKYEFKYITIRTEIPKVPVTIEQHSVRKQEYIPCSDGLDHYISVMPPFNDYHTCKEDIQDGWATTDAELKNLSDNKYKGDVIKNKPPVLIHIEAEEREPQFKGELKEKYNKRPLIDIPGIGNPPVAGTYPGYIDGRAISCTVTTATTVPWTENDEDNDVVGDVDNRKAGTISYRWEIVDVTGPGVDRIYNQQGQDVSTMRGKFVLYDWDDNGVDEWIMCVDYLNLRETLWADGVAALNEDYMCFFAVDYDETGDYYWLPNNFNDWQDNYAAGPGQIYTDRWVEWETWMTEQFHTIPDVYTEISIDEGPDETKDQLYMLTSAWVSDQSQLRAIYYEDSYLRQTDDPHLYEFYVPAEFFTIVNGGVANIEIFLTHTHDRQQILLELLDGTLNPLASDNPAYAHDCVISWPVNEPGKYWVRISADAIWSPDLEPEYYNVTIEVRTQGARVKFWYDPDDTQDLYVNSVGTPSDCIAGMGDYNKNGAVDFTDFVAFAQAYNNPGGYTECFDFDEDGDIDFTDFVAFAQRYPLDSCRTSNCPSCSGTFAGDPGEPPWAYWEPTDPVCP